MEVLFQCAVLGIEETGRPQVGGRNLLKPVQVPLPLVMDACVSTLTMFGAELARSSERIWV